MAGAHAKFTGEPRVCLATSGPGAIHLLNGLYDAGMDHQPVVAIVGQAATTALGGDYQQEVIPHRHRGEVRHLRNPAQGPAGRESGRAAGARAQHNPNAQVMRQTAGPGQVTHFSAMATRDARSIACLAAAGVVTVVT